MGMGTKNKQLCRTAAFSCGCACGRELGLTHVTLGGQRQSSGFKLRAFGERGVGEGYGVSGVAVAALTEAAVGAVKRVETGQVGVE